MPSVPSISLPSLARRVHDARRSEIRDLLRIVDRPDILSLAGGLPAPSALPVDRIRDAADRALSITGANGAAALQYGPTEGLDELRALAAAGTAGSPRLRDADTTLVTTGSQQALDLVARALVDAGDAVGVEDPLYLGTRQVLEEHGARLVPIATDANGLDVDALADRLARGLRPKLVACVPNFSNPTGATLATERRERLAELAMRHGFVIVEDDAYHGLGFDGTPPDPVGALAPDHTVTLGSASKMIAPGLRVGWLGAPAWLVPHLGLLKQSTDLHTSTFAQLVVADILRDAAFLDAHLASVRAALATNATVLRAAIAPAIVTDPPTGGMFLWGRTNVDTRAALDRAIAAGVAYVPGDAFTVARDGSRSVRLSFATLAPDRLAQAGRTLAEVLVGAP